MKRHFCRTSRAVLFVFLIVFPLAVPGGNGLAQGPGGKRETRMLLPPSYGNERVLQIKGREYVLSGEQSDAVRKIPLLQLKRIVSTTLSYVPGGSGRKTLTVRAGSASTRTLSDGEGFFHAELKAPEGTIWRLGESWVELIAGDGSVFRSAVHVPDSRAEFGLISDFDDTIKVTAVNDPGWFVAGTILGSAWKDRAVTGMAELYREFSEGEGGIPRPVHYVSAGPYLFSPRIVDFISVHGFPRGSLDLMKLDSPAGLTTGFAGGFGRETVLFKTRAIEDILSAFPGRKFILFGDSGQHDPEAYSLIAKRHPERVAAIYIRRAPKSRLREKEYPLCTFFSRPGEVRKDLVKEGILGNDQ